MARRRLALTMGSSSPISRWGHLALPLLFVLTRWTNLTLPGMAYDETTYLAWGLAINADWQRNLFIGAPQGKPPLHSLLIAIAQQLFADPVLGGRLVSAFTGALSCLAIYMIARRLFSERTAILAALLYILTPYTLLFDRQALTDSLLATSALWMMCCATYLLEQPDWRAVAGLAIALFVGLMTKSVAQLFPVLLLPLVLAMPRDKHLRAQLKTWVITFGIGIIGGEIAYALAFGLRPEAALVSQFEQTYGNYTVSLAALLAFPTQLWAHNITLVAGWLWAGLTPVLVVLALASLIAAYWLGRGAWPLAIWVVCTIAGQIAVANTFYDRHILFAIGPWLILIARLLECSYQRIQEQHLLRRIVGRFSVASLVGLSAMAMIMVLPTVQDARLLFDFDLANSRLGGFYGLNRMRDYLVQQDPATPIYVIVNHMAGPAVDGATVLMAHDPRFRVLRVTQVQGQWTIFDVDTLEIYPKAFFIGKPAYYCVIQGDSQYFWLAPYAHLVAAFNNQRGDESSIGLYRLAFDNSFR